MCAVRSGMGRTRQGLFDHGKVPYIVTLFYLENGLEGFLFGHGKVPYLN